jgi:uncharacterized membrane protein
MVVLFYFLLGIIVLLIINLSRTHNLSKEVQELKERINRLQRTEEAGFKATVSTDSAEGIPPTAPSSVPESGTSPSPLSSPPIGEPYEAPPPRSNEEWEMLIGGRLFNRVGALALILGVGFFLKYAFDNSLISEKMRVLIGTIVGVAFLVGGYRFHKKGMLVFAQGLVGAGVSILYLSFYASYNFYHLVSQPVAFGLMSAVTVLAFLQALKYDSLAVSLLGWVGGFITPFLLSTGQNNEIGLFTYVALLDAGLLALLVRKDAWAVLEPLTLASTFLTYMLWYQRFYTPNQFLPTILFLSIFWGLFFALDLFRIVKLIGTFRATREIVGIANAVFFYQGLYVIIQSRYADWTSIVTLFLGMIYFLSVLPVQLRRPEPSMTYARHTLTAVAFLALATSLRFSTYTTLVCWSLEGLILFGCGIRWRLNYIWQAALGLFVLASFRLIITEGAFSYVPISEFIPIFNKRFLAFASLSAAIGASAALFKYLSERWIAEIRTSLYAASLIGLITLSTVETRDIFEKAIFSLGPNHLNASGDIHRLRDLQELAHSGVWLLWAAILMGMGIWRRLQGVRIGAILLSGITILKIFIYDLSFLDTFHRIFSFIGLGLVLFGVSYLYQRYKAVFLIGQG